MEAGFGPTVEYQVALDQLEPKEFVALVTSAGLTVFGRPNRMFPVGRVFLTNRRVLYIFDGAKSLSLDLLNMRIRLERSTSRPPNRMIVLNDRYGVALAKQEADAFLELAETFARAFARPAGWYVEPGEKTGDAKQARYWNGSQWADTAHPIQTAAEAAIEALGYTLDRTSVEATVMAYSYSGLIGRPKPGTEAGDTFPAVIADDADWFYICRTDNLLADRLSLEDVSSCSLLGDEALSLNFVFRRSDESLRLIIRCAPDDTDSVGDTVSRLALVAERRYAATLTDLGLQPPGERGK